MPESIAPNQATRDESWRLQFMPAQRIAVVNALTLVSKIDPPDLADSLTAALGLSNVTL
jgi:hypothetical protein